MTVSGVTPAAAVALHASRPIGCGCRCRTAARPGADVDLHDHATAGYRPTGCSVADQHARRARRVQRGLAEPRAPLAADDRSSVDKATGEMIVTAPARLPGRVERRARRGSGSRRRSTAHALEAVGADRVVAVRRRRRALRRASRRYVSQGVPLQTWVVSAGPRRRPRRCSRRRRAARWSSSASASAHIRTRSSPTCRRRGFGGGMENATTIFYGEKGVASGRGAGRPRDRAPVVRQLGHRARLGRRVAERGVRDLFRAALHRAVRGPRRVRRRARSAAAPRFSSSKQKLPDTPVVHRNLSDMERVLNQFVYQKGGWVLHMLRARDRHRRVLDRHSRVLPPLSRSERLDRRSPPGDGAGEPAAKTCAGSSTSGCAVRGVPEDRRVLAI